jgi:hypothetical protein
MPRACAAGHLLFTAWLCLPVPRVAYRAALRFPSRCGRTLLRPRPESAIRVVAPRRSQDAAPPSPQRGSRVRCPRAPERLATRGTGGGKAPLPKYSGKGRTGVSAGIARRRGQPHRVGVGGGDSTRRVAKPFRRSERDPRRAGRGGETARPSHADAEGPRLGLRCRVARAGVGSPANGRTDERSHHRENKRAATQLKKRDTAPSPRGKEQATKWQERKVGHPRDRQYKATQ